MPKIQDRGVTFVDANAVATLPPQARQILCDLYVHEKDFRTRILSADQRDRRNLMRAMYERTWAFHNELDALVDSTPYQSAAFDRTKDAAALRRLVPPPARVIELGAGGGALCAELARCGWQVEGTDVVEGRDWKLLSRELGITFHCGELEELKLEAGAYDLCIMDNALEHFPSDDYQSTIRNVFSLLRPGGWFVAIVPNRLVGPHDVSRYFVSRGRSAEASHFNERRISELGTDLKSAGFRNVKTVAYAALAAGRRFGWSRFWYWKAVVSEAILACLPPALRNPLLFAYMVPTVVAAQKRCETKKEQSE